MCTNKRRLKDVFCRCTFNSIHTNQISQRGTRRSWCHFYTLKSSCRCNLSLKRWDKKTPVNISEQHYPEWWCLKNELSCIFIKGPVFKTMADCKVTIKKHNFPRITSVNLSIQKLMDIFSFWILIWIIIYWNFKKIMFILQTGEVILPFVLSGPR